MGLIIYEKPRLRRPYLIAGFEGWPDAGKISTQVVGYLKDKLAAKEFAEFEAGDFYLFQSPGVELLRPTTRIEEGLIKELNLPSIKLWNWINEGSAHDLVILFGMEPHIRWNQFVDSLLDFAQEYQIRRIYTIGGTYDKLPHTVEPLISAVINKPRLKGEMKRYGIELTNYSGPSSVHTLLLNSAGKRGLEAISLWGHAPHYIQVPNAKVCYSLLKRLTLMLEIEIDLEDLKEASENFEKQVNRAIEQKAELVEYIKGLEEEYLRGRHEAGRPLSEDIIREVEDFLRKRKNGEG